MDIIPTEISARARKSLKTWLCKWTIQLANADELSTQLDSAHHLHPCEASRDDQGLEGMGLIDYLTRAWMSVELSSSKSAGPGIL